MLAVLAPLVLGALPAQDAAAPAAAPPAATAPAPRAVWRPRGLVLAERTRLRFSVPTNGGVMTGTIPVRALEVTGIDGRGAFEVRLVVDGRKVEMKDPMWERFFADQVFAGTLTAVASERLPAPAVPEGEAAPPPRMRMKVDRPGAQAFVVTYGWEGDAASGTIHVEHAATVEALGLLPVPHPFLRAEGPVELKLEAKLVRGR